MISVRFQAPAQSQSVRAGTAGRRVRPGNVSVRLSVHLPCIRRQRHRSRMQLFPTSESSCGNALPTAGSSPDPGRSPGSRGSHGRHLNHIPGPHSSPDSRHSPGPHRSPGPHDPGRRTAGDHFQVPGWCGPATRFPFRGWSAAGGGPLAPASGSSALIPLAPTAGPSVLAFRFDVEGAQTPDFQVPAVGPLALVPRTPTTGPSAAVSRSGGGEPRHPFPALQLRGLWCWSRCLICEPLPQGSLWKRLPHRRKSV